MKETMDSVVDAERSVLTEGHLILLYEFDRLLAFEYPPLISLLPSFLLS